MRLSSVRCLRHISPYFRFGSQVQTALGSNEPIVALESTVITHGMPYPSNLETANLLESIVVKEGAVPATIAILDGLVRIGLEKDELERLARGWSSLGCVKVSRRDVAHTIWRGLNGGTTVSSTMLLAHQAGIKLFATGGIGGVHRDGQNSMDVSADLTELGKTNPPVVVCAGVKSILDIALTLEYLETQGVCVATVGPTNDFPSFYSRRSGYFSPQHVKNETEAAELILTQESLNIQSGILLAVPIPKEDEIPGDKVEHWLQQALADAKLAGISGKRVTPFLLSRLNELSGGETLKANIALLKNNARTASKIAVELKRLEKISKSKRDSGALKQQFTAPALENCGRPVVIGGIVADLMAKCDTEFHMNGSTHGGKLSMTCGGVGRNIADGLSRFGDDPILLSAVGDDYHGHMVKNDSRHLDLSYLRQDTSSFATSSYIGLLNNRGQLYGGVMDMSIHAAIDSNYVRQHEAKIKRASLVVLDGNPPVECMDYILSLAQRFNLAVWFETTDLHKAESAFLTNHWRHISYLSPNVGELKAIYHRLGISIPATIEDMAEGSEDVAAVSTIFQHIPSLQILVLKLGKRGSLVLSTTKADQPFRNVKVWRQNSEATVYAKFYKAPSVASSDIVSVSGSGDCMVAGIAHGILKGWSLDQSVHLGTMAAARCLLSLKTVPETLNDLTALTVKPHGKRQLHR